MGVFSAENEKSGPNERLASLVEKAPVENRTKSGYLKR
jgi:hypothetical protein